MAVAAKQVRVLRLAVLQIVHHEFCIVAEQRPSKWYLSCVWESELPNLEKSDHDIRSNCVQKDKEQHIRHLWW